MAPPAIGNLDDAPELEVVTNHSGVELGAFNFDGSATQGEWRSVFQGVGGGLFIEPPQVADLDDLGADEVIQTDLYHFTHVIDYEGNLLQSLFDVRNVSAYPNSSPAIGDIDGDGDLEIFQSRSLNLPDSGSKSAILAWHHDGAPVSGWPVIIQSTHFPTDDSSSTYMRTNGAIPL